MVEASGGPQYTFTENTFTGSTPVSSPPWNGSNIQSYVTLEPPHGVTSEHLDDALNVLKTHIENLPQVCL